MEPELVGSRPAKNSPDITEAKCRAVWSSEGWERVQCERKERGKEIGTDGTEKHTERRRKEDDSKTSESLLWLGERPTHSPAPLLLKAQAEECLSPYYLPLLEKCLSCQPQPVGGNVVTSRQAQHNTIFNYRSW
ncbi:hypothetical protein CMUS01_14368 [Colletotrichum musicola]|uniref:Uncharacterized protein n=1 Tax=Colletotrichum musicola TaxID=2175873 RepID=A0A8H6J5L6_9PEZI|nr:hypothetical protein CMUS01_14368 [Colletotrichum musicola]